MRRIKISFIFFTFLIFSCTIPKSARELKRATKDWRKSEKVLWGYGDSPFGSTNLILTSNNKFELTSSGFFMFWFEAGTWAYEQDTIELSFVNKQLIVNKTQKVYLNRQNYQLYFQNADTTELILRVFLNNLDK